MSYCVNCGVELDESANKCALCSTPVYNPSKKEQETAEKQTPFSQTTFYPKEIKRRFVAYIITMVLLIPNVVCTFTNIIFQGHGFWSLYVNASSFLAWVIFVFPFCTKKLRPYLIWFFNTVAVCSYVFFFFVMRSSSGGKWFYNTALPIILSLSFLSLVYMMWVRHKKRHWVLKTLHITADTAVMGIVSGLVLEMNLGLKNAFGVGCIVFVSALLLIAFLIYCYSSKHMRAWLSRKFFV